MSAPERLRYDLVQVAPWRGSEAAFAERLRAAGWQLPAFGKLWSAPGRLACSVRPGRWLLAADPTVAAPVGTLAARCETAIAESGAVTDLSAARSAWRISGPQARARLSAGCRLDLDPAAFPPGRATVTLITQVPVFIASLDDGWLLMVPTSMTEHLEGWLHHAVSR
ncbi:MAG: sarcosine oxidase subunit gamma [Planctomycetota bacterium]